MISIVLLQSGKGAQIGATFGGSGQTLFGSRGTATLLNKVTTISAIVFMLTSFGLTYFASISDDINVPEGKIQKTSEMPPIAEHPQPVQVQPDAEKVSEETSPPQAVQEEEQVEQKPVEPATKEQKAE